MCRIAVSYLDLCRLDARTLTMYVPFLLSLLVPLFVLK